jgi:hypothetical protein
MSELRLIPPSSENSGQEASCTAPCFDDFWVLYPRHVAKLAARKAWAKVDPSAHVAILEALVSWRPVWRDKDPEFLPHASTYLNGERWTDELPQGFQRRTAESTPGGQNGHQSDSGPVGGTRQTIPPHVQAVIDRLTGKRKPG